jgi:SAM-dependent methyltransferase
MSESPMSKPDSSVGQAWANHFKAETNAYHIPDDLRFLRKFIHSPFVQLLKRYARPTRGSLVLEGGCASGKFSLCFALLGCDVTALDYSPEMLENVASLQQTVERQVGPLKLALHQGDLEHLDLKADHFDLVFNEGVVEHWLNDDERRAVLRNLACVTRPHGTVAVIVPNGHHPWMTRWMETNPAFLSAPPMVRYSPQMLRNDLMSVGLQDLVIDGIYAWRSIDQWPNEQLRLVGGALQKLIPLPHRLRLKWGIHLIGMGRKA